MALTVEFNPNQDIDNSPKHYIIQGGTAKPTGVPVGSTCWDATNNITWKTYDGTNWGFFSAGGGRATKSSSSPLTSGDIFTYTGTVGIVSITGRVTTAIQNTGTTLKLQHTPDALSAQDLCATIAEIKQFLVGTLLSITGTAADAMLGTTGVGGIVPGQAGMPVLTCVTAGKISTVFSATPTGVIVWEVLWIPLSTNASLVAA